MTFWIRFISFPLLLAAHTSTGADAPAEPRVIRLQCTESPVKEVAFDSGGQVTYQESAALSQGVLSLTISKSDPDQAAYRIEPARIESSVDWLDRPQAVWSREDQIDADNGRLRIDLRKNRLFLTEPLPNGNARFRRFECERVEDEPAPVR